MAVVKWHMKGSLIGACNCDWGCPCSFDARPTRGYCDGVYAWVVKEGAYGGIDLSGVSFIFGGHAPGAVHEGNLTSVIIVDAAANDRQRDAILTLS